MTIQKYISLSNITCHYCRDCEGVSETVDLFRFEWKEDDEVRHNL
jgi:hypothetical protein